MGQGTDGSESPQAESEPRLRVAYLGAWIPTKGVHLLLEAFRELDPDRARLDVHGYALPYEGHEDYEQQLRDLAEGLPHVRLGQRYAPEDVPTLLEGVDVLVAPSTWYENSPLSVHEAFLAGAVVVASNHGGLRELVEHEVNGLTFEPGSAASLGAALQRLIDDPDLLERLRRHETPVMEIAEHALALEGIYAAVLADPGDA
jgi:glycosyltransferase involved in cell wall biosynthesis